MIRAIFGLVLAALTLASLQACRFERPMPAPNLPKTALSGQDRSKALEEISARSHEVTTWRGLSRTLWQDASGTARLRHAIVFSRPDQLRLETLPPGGAFTINILLIDRSQVLFLDAERKSAIRSEDAAGLLREVLGIRVSIGELMAYLTGRVPEQSGIDEFFRSRDGARLILRRDGRRYFFLDPLTYTLQKVHVRDRSNDLLQYEIDCSHYRTINNVHLPSQISIWIPDKELRISLQFSTLTVNTPVSDSLYHAAVPADYSLSFF